MKTILIQPRDTIENKLRLCLVHREALGLSMETLVRNFVLDGKLTQDVWNQIVGEELHGKERKAIAKKVRPPRPVGGPGTESMAIMAALGAKEKPGCDCRGKALRMDYWGVAGCRKHYWEIVGWWKDGYQRYGWGEAIKAAGMAAVTGLALKIRWTDPWSGFLDEALRRAEAKGESGDPAGRQE